MLTSSRRNFLTLGSIGGLSLGLSDYLKLKAEDNLNPSAKANGVIYIYLPGGFAAQETFDPKPLSPIEYRGPLDSIETSVAGLRFSQNLKDTAKIANKITVIHSMTHGETAHERGTNNMFTGWRPSPALQYPSIGSIISHELGIKNNLPPYVTVPSVPNEYAGAGFLSHSYSSFSLGSNPEDPNFKVRDLKIPNEVDSRRFDQRKRLLDVVNNSEFRKRNQTSDALIAVDSFYENAFNLMTSNPAVEAFDISKETEEIKEKYGKNSAGMRMLLCRRLIEAGVRFVTMTYGGWDHHDNIGGQINNQLPAFDRAYAALINDLDQRGLLNSTLVCITTEFGRTPKINKDSGRDHWPQVNGALLFGGGLKHGQVIGSTNRLGEYALDRPVDFQEIIATIYHTLGVDISSTTITDTTGRPQFLVENTNMKEFI